LASSLASSFLWLGFWLSDHNDAFDTKNGMLASYIWNGKVCNIWIWQCHLIVQNQQQVHGEEA